MAPLGWTLLREWPRLFWRYRIDVCKFHQNWFCGAGPIADSVTLQPVILTLVQNLVAQRILDDSFLNFKYLSHFLSRFLSRVARSFRLAQLMKQPVIDNVECVHFLAQLTAAHHRYPSHLLLNFRRVKLVFNNGCCWEGSWIGSELCWRMQKPTFRSSLRSLQKARGSCSSWSLKRRGIDVTNHLEDMMPIVSIFGIHRLDGPLRY
jgi:hypothetical protein